MSSKLKANFSEKVGQIKPLHGVNNGPLTGGFECDASEYFKKAQIPYSRLHDTEGAYGCGEFVDIPCVFKCFDADAQDPASYNFTLTDHYIKSILNVGTKVIYRLGVTIENGPVKKYIYPPKDYLQWAKICEGIIRHYTEGWADGFVGAVEYFEIWNEPDFQDHMWIGEDEKFFELFKSASIYLKERFPNVKIGGPAMGSGVDGEYLIKFLDYMAAGEERAPLDFFSWHFYWKDPHKASELALRAKSYLQKYGYDDTEILCTEWNYVESWNELQESLEAMRDIRGAAISAASLSELQKSPCWIAAYYDAQKPSKCIFNGLFRSAEIQRHADTRGVLPYKAYYSFYAFNQLYRLQNEAYSESEDENTFILAAADGEKAAVLLSRFDKSDPNPKTYELDLADAPNKKVQVYTLDAKHDLELTDTADCLKEIVLDSFCVKLLIWED